MNLPCPSRALRPSPCAVTLLFLLAAPAAPLSAQEPGTVRVSAPAQSSAGAPVPVTLELVAGETIERVALLYRLFGTSEFLRMEMDLRGNSATALIPGSALRPPVLEYYFVLTARSGLLVSHPFSRSADPFGVPPDNLLRITVRPEGERDGEVLFLSPEENARVEPDDLVVSVSLLRVDTLVNRAATRLLLDGMDVTGDAVRADDMIVYVPANTDRLPAPGPHTVTVLLYRQDGGLHWSSSLSFTLGTAQPGITTPAQPDTDIRTAASVQLESRHERLGDNGTWYNRAGLTASGTYGDWTLRSNLFVTSDERSDRQPQNRFFIGAVSPWIQAGYGDAYPSFTPLILDGKRVRGGHARLALGMFRLDATTGQTDRPIEGRLLKVIGADTVGFEQERDPGAAYAPLDAATWGKFTYGSYERTLWGLHPSIGADRDWRFGLSILKGKDDAGSIRYGIRPQENLVIGSDFVIRAFEEAVEISGEGAFSAFNTDISSGTFTDAYIDSVYPDQADEIRTVRDILDNFITVNDNLRPLSLTQLATAAYQFAFGLTTGDNAFRFTYLYRGSDYTSFGQSFLRKDIKGFTLQDRLRLIDNTLFLSLSWERLNDNTAQIKPATTTFSSVDLAVSYYPGTDLPSVTVGVGFLGNDNDLAGDLPDAIDEAGSRFFLQSTSAFDLGVRHTASLGLNAGARNDRTARDADIRDLALALGLSSLPAEDLQTTVEYAYSRTTRPVLPGSPPEAFAYSTATLAARYSILPREVVLRATVGPTFGDVRRTLLSAGVEWFVTPTMAVMLDGTYFARPGGPYDSIGSLRYRYDL